MCSSSTSLHSYWRDFRLGRHVDVADFSTIADETLRSSASEFDAEFAYRVLEQTMRDYVVATLGKLI